MPMCHDSRLAFCVLRFVNPSTAPAALATPSKASIHSTVLLLSAASFLSGIALRICDSLLPRLALDFSITAGTAGRVVLTFSIAYSLMQLVFGPLGDRFGKARMVSIALAGCALLSLAASLSQGFDWLLAARTGWGMAAAGVIPLAMAWIGDAVPYDERQATLARLLLGTLSGMIAGQLAGGLFAETVWGWRGAFMSLAAGYAVICAWLIVSLRRMPKAPPPAGTGWAHSLRQSRQVLVTPWTWRVLSACFAEGVLLLGALAFLPTFLHQRFGMSMVMASAMLALYAVGGLVYAVWARRIIAFLGERGMVRLGGWLMGLGFLVWWLSPVAWTAGLVALVVGFGTYLYHNTLQTHATQMAPQSRGTAVAMFAFCLFFGQAIGVTLAGFAFDHLGATVLLLVPAVGLPLAGEGFARALARRTPPGA